MACFFIYLFIFTKSLHPVGISKIFLVCVLLLLLFFDLAKFLPHTYTHTKCCEVPSGHTAVPTNSPSVVFGFSLLLFLSSAKYSYMFLRALPLLFPRLSYRRVTGAEEMSARVAATGEGSGGWWGFISGCILGRKTSCFLFYVFFLVSTYAKTKSAEEKCKETNWNLENLEHGKQSFNLSTS